MLIDPRNTTLQPGVDPSQIVLIDRQMDIGDTFTVNIRYVPTATFYLPTVAAS
jgi:hypothetical protein